MQRCLLAIALCLASTFCLGQTLTCKLSTREAFIGQRVSLEVRLINARRYETPQIPKIDGLQIRRQGQPSVNHQFSFRNGVRSNQTSITWHFEVIPSRAGEFTIPPFDVLADGSVQRTALMRFVVSKSETGDLMFLEVDDGELDNGEQSDDMAPAPLSRKAYVGQAVKLKLRLWLRPYVDRELNLKMSAQNMWGMIDDRTSWGVFEETLDEVREGEGELRAEEVLRNDGEGNSRAYYLYELEKTIYPKRPGKVDVGEVHVIVNYPTSLKVNRRRSSMFDDSFFGGSLLDEVFGPSPFSRQRVAIDGQRPITKLAISPAIEVVDIPTKGRPKTYRGAVGEYQFGVQASPTKVNAGDPITLQLVLEGNAPMELVESPPLSEVQELTDGFKIAEDTLAGFVQGNAKLFSTTIRPLRDDIDEIPPIPFSFFNPKTQCFETVYSQPIPITVAIAEKLSLDEIVGNRDATSSRQPQKPEGSLGDRADATDLEVRRGFDVDAILRVEPQSVSLPWLAIVLPPCLVGIAWLVRDGKSILRSWKRRPNRLQAAINAASDSDSHSTLVDVLAPLRGQSPELDDITSRSELAAYSPMRGEPLSELREAAIRELRKLGTIKPQLTAAALVFLLLSCFPDQELAADIPTHLTVDQQRILVEEANQLLNEGIAAQAVTRTEKLVQAVNKYKLVAQSGLQSPELFHSLAICSQELNQKGQAVAYFEKAHRLCPGDWSTMRNLRQARAELTGVEQEPTMTMAAELNVSVQWVVRWIATASWCLAWLVLGVRLFRGSFALSKLLVTLLFACSLIAFASNLVANYHIASFDGVIVADQVELRQGDGEVFAGSGSLSAGQRVKLIEERGGWWKVESEEAASRLSGWLRPREVLRLDG